MLNQSVFVVLVTFSLSAIFVSAAPATTFNRQSQLDDQELLKSEPDNDYEYEPYVDDSDSPGEDVYVDRSLLAQEVAKADHVEPPKYIYETTHEKFDREPILDSNVHTDIEDHQFISYEELITSKELEQERLRNVEAQIIPIHHEEDNSGQLRTDEKIDSINADEKLSEHDEHTLSNAYVVLNDFDSELVVENHHTDKNIHKSQHTVDDDELEPAIIENFYSSSNVESADQNTDKNENANAFHSDDIRKKLIEDFYTALEVENHQNTENDGKLGDEIGSTLEVENHQDTDDGDDNLGLFSLFHGVFE